MFEQNILEGLLLLIAVILPPQSYMGPKGFLRHWDRHIEKPAKRLPPPKLIQLRYGIGKYPINIITYLTFLADFAAWIICLCWLFCMFFLEETAYNTVVSISVSVFALLYIPSGIACSVCCIKIAKKNGWSLHSEEYVAARSIAESLKTSRETKKWLNEYDNVIKPFSKEFERYLDKQRGVKYITEHKLEIAVERIFPKYQKQLSYTISNEDSGKRFLTVTWILEETVIIHLPIRKK